MMHEKLKEYIQSNLRKGHKEKDIRAVLLMHGYNHEHIEPLFAELKRERKNFFPIIISLTFICILLILIFFIISSLSFSQPESPKKYFVIYTAKLINGYYGNDYSNTVFFYPDHYEIMFIDSGIEKRYIVNGSQSICTEGICYSLNSSNRKIVAEKVFRIDTYYEKFLEKINADKSLFNVYNSNGAKCFTEKSSQDTLCVNDHNLPTKISMKKGDWSIYVESTKSGVID